MQASAPIGVFDSGLGGISVVKDLHRMLPGEDIIFFGDSHNAPYGTKTPEQVRNLSFHTAQLLIEKGVKAIIIACNTATSAAAPLLREQCEIPIIGMEPALKVACELDSAPQTVVVSATALTLKEEKFASLVKRFAQSNNIYPNPCPDLVTIIENGQLENTTRVEHTIQRYFQQYTLSAIDSVVLGCTHFVFYRKYFHDFFPDTVHIIDGNEGTVHHLQHVLNEQHMINPQKRGTVTLLNSDESRQAYAQYLLNDVSLHRKDF
ncbi:MAG: glutamate racemase [Bifidobacteriaceae bacterium]|nr:glutamate racemase [Bifidobacteriaceae bacterium]